jgi:hypothetical protein
MTRQASHSYDRSFLTVCHYSVYKWLLNGPCGFNFSVLRAENSLNPDLSFHKDYLCRIYMTFYSRENVQILTFEI